MAKAIEDSRISMTPHNPEGGVLIMVLKKCQIFIMNIIMDETVYILIFYY